MIQEDIGKDQISQLKKENNNNEEKKRKKKKKRDVKVKAKKVRFWEQNTGRRLENAAVVRVIRIKLPPHDDTRPRNSKSTHADVATLK